MRAADVTLADLSGDPHAHLAALRATAPVVEVPALGGFLVVGRADALRVLRDPQTFTVDDPRFSTAQVVGPSMLSLDGADHARHRQPFSAPFRPTQVGASLGDVVRAAVSHRVEQVARMDGRAELRAALAGPVAASVMATTLGLDGADAGVVDRLLGWYRAIVASVSGVAEGRRVTADGQQAMTELAGALGIARGALLEGAVAAGLTPAEAVSNAAVLLFGGIETTEGMILNALWFILRHQPHGDTAAAVEESLRLEPAAAVVDRYATADAVVGGVRIPNGAFVEVSLAAANRDPAEFSDPDRFDPARPNLTRQLAFATGPHVCLGMDLARLETVTAIDTLLRRLPGLRISAGSPPPTGLVFRKPQRLDVEWNSHGEPEPRSARHSLTDQGQGGQRPWCR